jgi:hypothetical protein
MCAIYAPSVLSSRGFVIVRKTSNFSWWCFNFDLRKVFPTALVIVRKTTNFSWWSFNFDLRKVFRQQLVIATNTNIFTW